MLKHLATALQISPKKKTPKFKVPAQSTRAPKTPSPTARRDRRDRVGSRPIRWKRTHDNRNENSATPMTGHSSESFPSPAAAPETCYADRGHRKGSWKGI